MKISIYSLLDGHDAIMRSARLLLDAVAGDRIVPARAAARLATLATTISAHLKHERDFVYAIEDHRRNGEAAAEFAAELTALGADWQAYLQDWPAPHITTEPAGFTRATQSILPRMLARIDRENEYLYPRALQISAVSLR